MRHGWVVLVGVAACADESVSLSFVQPSSGASFSRDQLGATGALVAKVPVELDVGGSPARIGLAAGPATLADADAAGAAGVAEVPVLGALSLIATAYDDDDAPLASATVDIAVGDAPAASCRDWLALYQVAYTDGPARLGVADPITAEVPIVGLTYRAVGADKPRATLFADCNLIVSLARAASILRERGITEVTDYGVYNYRCIGSGTPPNCPNGMSQHAYANAIDLAAFTDVVGTTFVVNDDWVIDPDAEKTCAAPTEGGKDQFLHELICALKAARTWNIVLTPNYNADHRNHFHVDLTPGSNFIE